MTVSVVLADDHPVVRVGLRGALTAYPYIDVVGEAGSGDEAYALAAALRPDVILMDLRMPGTDGVTATARITRDCPGVRVLVLTTYDTDRDILRAIEAGATGYLLKDTPMETIAEAVRSAASGETVLAPPVAGRLIARMRAPAPTRLTPREAEVLGLVAEGLSNGEIATRLHIGEATVKTHLLRTFTKLDVTDRTAAIAAAVQRGLIAPPWDPR